MRPRWLGGRRYPSFERDPTVPRWCLLVSILGCCLTILVLELQHRSHADLRDEVARLQAIETRARNVKEVGWCRKEYLACLVRVQKNQVRVEKIPR